MEKTTESNPIFDLILAQREKNDEAGRKMTYQDVDTWLLGLYQQMGELATALIPLPQGKKPEWWKTQEVNAWQLAYGNAIEEAVRSTAKLVEACEWLSNRIGWPNTALEVLNVSNRSYKWSDGEPVHCYYKMASSLFPIGFDIIEKRGGVRESASYHFRAMVFHGCDLIYRLQKKKEVDK